MPEESIYRDKLEAAIAASGMSKRGLAAAVAERTGLDLEGVRRALYKYLDPIKPSVPEPERAALLAVILDAPELALVSAVAERRTIRLAELEARVADLEQKVEAHREALDALGRDLTKLEDLAPARTHAGRPRSRRGNQT